MKKLLTITGIALLISLAPVQQTEAQIPIYEIIKERMLLATPLLETLAQELSQKIYNFDSRIKNISVSVEKKNPPISNMEGSVSVHYKKAF